MDHCPEHHVYVIVLVLAVIALGAMILVLHHFTHFQWDRVTVCAFAVVIAVMVLVGLLAWWRGINPFPSNPCKDPP